MLALTVIIFTLLVIAPCPHADPRQCYVRKSPTVPIQRLEENYAKWLVNVLPNYIAKHQKSSETPSDCGRQQTQALRAQMHTETIEGGRMTQLMKWPWFVIIKTKDRSGTDDICGGTLIHWHWVLTAAHCVDMKKIIDMKFGSIRVMEKKKKAPHRIQLSSFDRLYINPYFARGLFGNDIALIRLQHLVHFSEYVHPICMPPPTMHFGPNDQCYMLGVGKKSGNFAKVVNEIKAHIMDKSSCAAYLKKDGITYSHNSMFCNGLFEDDKTRNHGVCLGDSGGPFNCLKNGKWYVAGVIESFYNCEGKEGPDVMTNVTHFRKWLESITSF